MFVFGSTKEKVIGSNPDLSNLDVGNLKFEIDFRSVYASLLQHKLHFDYSKIGIKNSALAGLF